MTFPYIFRPLNKYLNQTWPRTTVHNYYICSFHGNFTVFLWDLSLCVFCLFSCLVLSLLWIYLGECHLGSSDVRSYNDYFAFMLSWCLICSCCWLNVCTYGVCIYMYIYACIFQFIFSLSFYEFSVCLNIISMDCRFSRLLASYSSKSLFLPL